MPFKNQEDRIAYYHRKGKDTLYRWRKKNDWWNNYQREFKKKKTNAGITRTWERIKNDPTQLSRAKKASQKWVEANREEIRRNNREETANLDDSYIKKQLVKDGFTIGIINANPSLIELKRIILKIKRL